MPPCCGTSSRQACQADQVTRVPGHRLPGSPAIPIALNDASDVLSSTYTSFGHHRTEDPAEYGRKTVTVVNQGATMHTMSLQSSRTSTAIPGQGFSRLIVAAPATRRAWAELTYAATDPLAAAMGFAFIAAICILGAPFVIATAGLPVTAGLACTRRLAAAERL